MKGLKIDAKKIAMQTAGNAAGLVAVTMANKVGFVQKQKPLIKGLITLALGRLVLPMIAAQTGFAKKSNDLVEGASAAMSTLGVMQIAGSFETAKPADKKLFPVISGMNGYEDAPYPAGLGMVTDEEVSGPGDEENNGMSGNDEYYGG